MRQPSMIRAALLLLWCGVAWGQSAQINLSQFAHVLTGGGGVVLPQFSVSTPPSSICNWNSITTAFQVGPSSCASLAFMGLGGSLLTTGTADGTPNTGYLYTPNYSLLPLYRDCRDGFNFTTNSNQGRNACLTIFGKVDQNSTGGGDAPFIALTLNAFTTNSAATSFLASTQVSPMQVGFNGWANGVYLEDGDYIFTDKPSGNTCPGGSCDIAVMGRVIVMNRNNATGNTNNVWVGIRGQSTGPVPIDAPFSLSGKTRFFIDASAATWPDQVLTGEPAVATAGTGYSTGQVVSAIGGTCDQEPQFKLTAPSGGITAASIAVAGLCSVPPSNPVSLSVGAGQLTLAWTGTAAPFIVSPADTYWYSNAQQDTSVFNTSFPSTAITGTSKFGWSSALTAWSLIANNTSVAQFGPTIDIFPVKIAANGGISSPIKSVGGTVFSVASGTGACASTSGVAGGVQAGQLQCTGTTGASTVTLTLAASTTAYSCWGRDVTTPTTVTQTGSISTTSVTLTLTSVTANDVLQFGCLGY